MDDWESLHGSIVHLQEEIPIVDSTCIIQEIEIGSVSREVAYCKRVTSDPDTRPPDNASSALYQTVSKLKVPFQNLPILSIDRSGQVWGHTPEQRVAASTLRRYSFGLPLAIAQADARPAMPVSFR